MGSLFEYVDRHYNHSNTQYPPAHNLVTSHYVSGAVRFPVDGSIYRRYEEFTEWETFVEKHFPGEEIPRKKKERTRFHKWVDPELLKDPEFQALDEAFKTKIVIASELTEQAVARDIPFGWVGFCSMAGIWRLVSSLFLTV